MIDLDPLDLRIVNALQVQPRASWALVASVVGASAPTVTRRWERMQERGVAWITTAPAASPHSACAVVEIDCLHGRTIDVAQALAEDPFTGNVAIHAGGRNILFELIAPTQQDLSRYVLERLDRLDGIRAVRTHPVTGVYSDGSKWRLGALTPKEEDRLRIASRPDEARYQPRGTKKTMRSVGALTPVQRQVANVLETDPRMTIRQLGQALGVSPTIARHRLEATLRAQPLIRCHMAPRLSGWPVRAVFFLNCPADRIEPSAQLLSRTPHVRAVFHTVGPHNLYIATSLRSLEDIGHLEAEIVTRLPHVTIADRSFEMRLCKSIGIVLGDDGLLARRVPVN